MIGQLFSFFFAASFGSTSLAILAASIDYAGIGSLIAALSAFAALYLGHRTNKRNTKNTETVSYVDTNLKTMQTTMDWLKEDNARLRSVNEEQRLVNEEQESKIAEISAELVEVKADLTRCRDQCAALIKRIDDKIGKSDDRKG